MSWMACRDAINVLEQVAILTRSSERHQVKRQKWTKGKSASNIETSTTLFNIETYSTNLNRNKNEKIEDRSRQKTEH